MLVRQDRSRSRGSSGGARVAACAGTAARGRGGITRGHEGVLVAVAGRRASEHEGLSATGPEGAGSAAGPTPGRTVFVAAAPPARVTTPGRLSGVAPSYRDG